MEIMPLYARSPPTGLEDGSTLLPASVAARPGVGVDARAMLGLRMVTRED
jgi:hypothetical protein